MYPLPHSSDFYGTNSTSYDDLLPSHFPSAPLPPPPHLLVPDQLESSLNMAYSHSSSTSGCSSYGSPNYATSHQQPTLMQRSISSHSLQKNNGVQGGFMSANEYYLDMETSPVRRVCSTGDLHRINMGQYCHRSGSPLASESSIIIEGMNRASRYSPEEKKERIERYRTKRTQRNFNKKIKYACRKTLADSRPRIRGRFARNEEIEKNPQVQWNNVGGEEDDEDDDNWISYLDSVSSGNLFS
ncbi:zinc finger protein CONSTANS-like [Melia azedarach]|uniref:Zinc finger protein CONSTANS-like n=1 Tax=Melia azedarach TaxID=155640 RepID=A0ACC1YRS9_MELAZ|nr:zinc finger protein CONSTANS-like [Melia azedarach]